MPSLLRAAVPFLVAALAAPAARADLVRLFDGKTVEGKSSVSGNKVTVKGWKGKSTTYAASEVKFREEGKCSWEVAADMARAIPGDASPELFVEKRLEIARYLKERRAYCPEMQELEAKEYEAVLRKAPENQEARVGLGHVRWGTWWFKNEAEREKFRKNAPASEMEPKGYVKFRKTGTWESKEDAEALEQGKVKYRGKWMTEDEKKVAQGFMKDEKGNWILAKDVQDREKSQAVEKDMSEKPVTVMSSVNFRMISWFPLADTAKLKELAEKTYIAHRDLLGIPVAKEEEEEQQLFGTLDVYLLIDGERKQKWCKAYGKARGWSDELYNHRYEEGATGWYGLDGAPYILIAGRKAEKNRERDVEGDLENARSSLTSMIARMLLNVVRPQQPDWFQEANGLLAEIRLNETADCNFASLSKYREEVANKQGSKTKYFEFMKKQIEQGVDRSFLEIFSLELNDLDWADSMKAWSLLEFLTVRYLPEFRVLLRMPMGSVEEILPIHVDAAIKAKKKKDPADAPLPGKGPPPEDTSLPTGPVRVEGPGAVTITQGSKEERAVRAAQSEAWLAAAFKKDFAVLEKEWREWILAHP